jgi:eukaryotic-like serine/threonine-protein kinase
VDEAGTLIADKYELVEVAGSGGMATVWRAIQRGAAGFQRTVAIKRIKEQLALDSRFRAMFVEEARVSAELVHPNIVQIHDFGDDAGRYFLVLEWVEGMALSRYLQVMREIEQRSPWHFVAGVGYEALKGLAVAHERLDQFGNPSPIFHRDVTPQNILLGVNGTVKLTDFGLARAMDRSRMTAPDVIKGKVGYLAPEMTQARAANARTDLYALGVVLWQALAGRRLFEGNDDIEIFIAASRSDIPPVSEVRPDVPQRFAAIVERALARDPEDRFRSADQMGRVIARLLRDTPEQPDQALIARCVASVRDFLKSGQQPSVIPSPPASRIPPSRIDGGLG